MKHSKNWHLSRFFVSVLDVPTGISKVIDKVKLAEFKDTFIECINMVREENKLSLSVIKEIVAVLNSVGFNINFY